MACVLLLPSLQPRSRRAVPRHAPACAALLSRCLVFPKPETQPFLLKLLLLTCNKHAWLTLHSLSVKHRTLYPICLLACRSRQSSAAHWKAQVYRIGTGLRLCLQQHSRPGRFPVREVRRALARPGNHRPSAQPRYGAAPPSTEKSTKSHRIGRFARLSKLCGDSCTCISQRLGGARAAAVGRLQHRTVGLRFSHQPIRVSTWTATQCLASAF